MKHSAFRKWCLLCFALLLALGSICGIAAEEQPAKTINDYWLTAVEMKAVYTEQPPSIDGTVEAGEWDHAYTLVYDPNDAEQKAFLEQYGVYKTNWPEGEKVTLRFLWDDGYLYILDSRVDRLVSYDTAVKADGTGALPWNKSEGANFGIQPLESLCLDDADGNIWQFYTSLADENAEPNGSVILRMCYPAVSTKRYTDIPEQTKVAAKLTEDGWQMELAIPWSGFQKDLPCLRPTAGYKMGFRISIGNRLEDGTQYWGNYTDRHGDFALSKSNLDFGGYPVLALADKDGNVPTIDLTIPPTILPPDPGTDDPDTGESDTPAPGTKPEPETPTGEPTGETTRPAETPANGKTLNVPLVVVLSVLIIVALAGGVLAVLKLKQSRSRILAGILAVAVVVGCVIGIFATVRSAKEASKPSDSEQQTDETEENTDPDAPVSRVPSSLKFPGEEVRFLIREVVKSEFNADYTGSVIDNAVYKRNSDVEARLGIDLKYRVSDAAQENDYQVMIRTSMMSGGSAAYDIITAHAYFGAALAAEGLYYNLLSGDTNNYISPELSWYNQSFVDQTSVNGILHYIVGDITLTATDRIVVSFFNEDAMATYGLQDLNLYEVVQEGKWTLEYVKTLIADIYTDRTGDGQTPDDFYGLVFNAGSMCVDAMLMAVGIHITQKDADGEISLAFNSKYSAEAYKALYDFMYGSTGIFLGSPNNNCYYGEYTTYYSEQAFFDRNAMIAFGMLESAKIFATDPSLHYGILPLPKYSEAQKTYATTPQDGYSIVSIPHNIGDRLSIATATLEVMSECSWHDVRPVYYDLAYKVRYASSATTAQLFNDIIDNISYDFGTLYSGVLENITWKLRNQLAGTSGVTPSYNLGGIYRVWGGSIEEKLTDLLEKFSD